MALPEPVGSSAATFVIPESSVHPALDGVGNARDLRGRNDVHIRGGDGDQSKRALYPSDAEFASGNTRRSGLMTGNCNAGDATMANEKNEDLSGSDDNSHHNDNQSDDGGQSDDEPAADIPTLDTYIPKEPSYDKANAVSFAVICKRLEVLWRMRTGAIKKRATLAEKIQYLLPDSLHKYLEGGSPFPYLRLILPNHDSSRAHTGMKEARIAEAWAKALGLDKKSRHYQQLVHFRNQLYVKKKDSIANLSCVIKDVMEEREPGAGSKLTVGEVNEWLDVLVDVVKDRYNMATENPVEKSRWRKDLERAVEKNRGGKKHDTYAILIGKLISKHLSPVEHKYIVRILLQHIDVGIDLKLILNYVNPHASELYNSFNSLKDLCTRLSDPEYVRLLNATVEKNTKEIMESNRNIWMTPSTLPASIQKTISPMLSRRTTFHTFLKEISYRHGQLDKTLPAESPAKGCMAIRHPAFACEMKMDGERDLVHIKRGVVTIQTRNRVWYSPLYSPAIGPALRAAISAYDVDVILDGEMIAWDDLEKKPIPFGSNRAAAEMERNRRRRDGTLDQRDIDLHKGETDINVMTLAKAKGLRGSLAEPKISGADSDDNYWLQYVVFDILYVDGPGAEALLSKSSHLFSKDEPARPGSVINMDCMQRKSILYNLLRPQENEVEHIRSVIVRSDGTSMDAPDYFLGKGGLEYGKTPCEMDSMYLAMCNESGTTKFDSQRMSGRTHEDVEVQRSFELEHLYKQIVESGGQEGLLFKDLASPYYLGAKSRSMGYWWKLKPDYDESGLASDIDLLVLGGLYADGFDRRGLMGSLIVGCLDPDNPYGGEESKYMTVTKVNFNKTPEAILFDETGYQRADENGEMNLGKWFISDDTPEYVSTKTYQRGPNPDDSGWKAKKDDRPDLWIRPQDSFVVTINAGEFQTSHSMQAGFTLRFPRISKYRGKTSEDPKAPDDIAHWGQLNTMFQEQEATRQDEVTFGSQGYQEPPETSRFLTAKQLEKSGRAKKATNSRKQTSEVKQFAIPDAGAPLSKVLDGFIFNVLPGNYYLESDAFAAAEAEEGGWAAEANSVQSSNDVIQYIQSHGGTCELTVHQKTDFLLGGSKTDAKVSNLVKLMAETDVQSTTKKEAEGRRLIEMGGVLKWSFVYAMVSKFLKQLDDDASGYEKSIIEDCPSLARPRRSDYLALSDKATLQSVEDQFGLKIDEIASSLDFARALEEAGRQRSKTKEGDASPWQNSALSDFPGDERWIFGGANQKLWPYGKDSGAKALCILYPDLFDGDYGFEDEELANKEAQSVVDSPRWNEVTKSKSLGDVSATLPLAKALGAIVTPHLHGGVTHVLCDLKRHKILKWTSFVPLTVFSDEEAGSRLHERLISLEETAALRGAATHEVYLVSPDWLEQDE